VPGRSHVFGSSGPMSVDVSGCVEILRAFWSKKWIHNQDAYIAPLDFQEEMYHSKDKLRIGKSFELIFVKLLVFRVL
jgi:hypothetical protein